MRDYVVEAFLEVWNRTGDAYMTRPEIARYFGKSAFWVQWMYVKSGAEPRTRAPSVKLREETGVDDRLEYIEQMAAKSAMNAAVKKLILRTAALKKTKVRQKDFLKKVVYLKKIMNTVQRHIERVSEFDPDWKHIPKAERALLNAMSVYTVYALIIEGDR